MSEAARPDTSRSLIDSVELEVDPELIRREQAAQREVGYEFLNQLDRMLIAKRSRAATWSSRVIIGVVHAVVFLIVWFLILTNAIYLQNRLGSFFAIGGGLGALIILPWALNLALVQYQYFNYLTRARASGWMTELLATGMSLTVVSQYFWSVADLHTRWQRRLTHIIILTTPFVILFLILKFRFQIYNFIEFIPFIFLLAALHFALAIGIEVSLYNRRRVTAEGAATPVSPLTRLAFFTLPGQPVLIPALVPSALMMGGAMLIFFSWFGILTLVLVFLLIKVLDSRLSWQLLDYSDDPFVSSLVDELKIRYDRE
jgi:hypothetical protein